MLFLKGYFAEQSEDWNVRKLTRVLTERAKSRSIAASAYFILSILDPFLSNEQLDIIDLPEG